MTMTTAANAITTKQMDPQDVLRRLRESGTPPDRLRGAENWLMQNPAATAEGLYGYLETQKPPKGDVQLGTLRKAGKLIYGDAFEPAGDGTPVAESKDQQAEIAHLRLINARLTEQLEAVNQKCLAVMRQSEDIRSRESKAQAHILRLYQAS